MAKQQSNSTQIKNVPVKRSNNGTVVNEVSNIQSGWAAITLGSASSALGFTITFPTAFATTPIVTVSFAGDQASGAVNIATAGSNVNGTVFVRVTNVTTTQCLVTLWPWNVANNASWATGNTVYVYWQATGA